MPTGNSGPAAAVVITPPKSPVPPGKPSLLVATNHAQPNPITLCGAGEKTATDNSASATPKAATHPPKSVA